MATGISLKPEDAIQGGLLQDVTVEITTARFEQWDYNGKVQPVPSLHLGMKDTESGEVYDQYWSSGSGKDYVPSEDGKNLIPTGSQTGLRKSSNCYLLMESVVSSGFPVDKLGNDISVLEGMVAYMVRVPAPEHKGLEKKTREDGKVFEQTVMVVGKIIKLPWEAAKPAGAPGKGAGAAKPGAGKSAATPAAPSTPAAEGAGDVAALATETIFGVVAASGPIKKANLPTTVYKALAGNPLQNKVMAMVGKPGFLEGIEGLAVVDGMVQFAAE